MNKTILATDVTSDVPLAVTQISLSGLASDEILRRGNRNVIIDFYVAKNVSSDTKMFAFNVFIRLNSKKGVKFTNISFLHCIFDGCYFNSCVFDSCDFTGCRFLGCNFHQSAFTGCKFDFATFERSQIDDDIVLREAPREENLRMRFARSLRMNYQQIGDAQAVNRAISVELEATSIYLYKSWYSHETYYRTKYPGLKKIIQFFKWSKFRVLDFIWGNGESILKLLRTIILGVIAIAGYDTYANGNVLNISDYWNSFQNAPAVFLGVSYPQSYPLAALSIIAGTRFIAIALLTALLIKRFSRR